jgi:hypothetical protein
LHSTGGADAPERNHTVVTLRLSRWDSERNMSIPHAKLCIVLLASPAWVVSSLPNLDTNTRSTFQRQSVDASRSIEAVTRCITARDEPDGVHQDVQHALRDCVVTRVLADVLGSRCLMATHVFVPSLLSYSFDADAVSFLMFMDRIATSNLANNTGIGTASAPATIAASAPLDASRIQPRALFQPSSADITRVSVDGPIGPPLFAPSRSGSRRRGSLTRAYYLSKGASPEQLVQELGPTGSVLAVDDTARAGRSRRASLSSLSSIGELNRSASHSIAFPSTTQIAGPYVHDVDQEAGINTFIDPKVRRLVTEHNRRVRAYGHNGHDPSSIKSDYIPIEEYMARAGPQAAAANLVSNDVFDVPAVAERVRKQRQATTASASNSTSRSSSSSRRPGTSKPAPRPGPSVPARSSRQSATAKGVGTTTSAPAARTVATSTSRNGAATVLNMLDLESQIQAELQAHERLSTAPARKASPSQQHNTVDVDGAVDELLSGDPVPGMRQLLGVFRERLGTVNSSTLEHLLSEFRKADSQHRGRLDDAAFAFALRNFARFLSWSDIEFHVRSMCLENCKGIDYADFVQALQTLAGAT